MAVIGIQGAALKWGPHGIGLRIREVGAVKDGNGTQVNPGRQGGGQ